MRSTRNLKTQVVISVFLVLLVSTAWAGRIIKVPLEFDNIQAAIDDANDGDMIFVSSGTYRGLGNRDIDFAGKAITLCSTDPSNPNIVAATIIDCQGSADEQHLGFFSKVGKGRIRYWMALLSPTVIMRRLERFFARMFILGTSDRAVRQLPIA